jgi:hypothetical protein
VVNERDLFDSVTFIQEGILVNLQKDTYYLDPTSYRLAYALHESHWGIQSPAFTLYQNFFSIHPHPDVLPKTTQSGLFIGVNHEILPKPRYKNYLAIHEWWEHYIRVRPEGNLLADDEHDYQLPILQRKRPAHRFAVLREFQQAQHDGVLPGYMEWWRRFCATDEKRIARLPNADITNVLTHYGQGATRETIIAFIEKNLELRTEIFKAVSSSGI